MMVPFVSLSSSPLFPLLLSIPFICLFCHHFLPLPFLHLSLTPGLPFCLSLFTIISLPPHYSIMFPSPCTCDCHSCPPPFLSLSHPPNHDKIFPSPLFFPPISHFICTLYCNFSPHIVAVTEDCLRFPCILEMEHWVFPKHEQKWLLLIGPCRCLLTRSELSLKVYHFFLLAPNFWRWLLDYMNFCRPDVSYYRYIPSHFNDSTKFLLFSTFMSFWTHYYTLSLICYWLSVVFLLCT